MHRAVAVAVLVAGGCRVDADYAGGHYRCSGGTTCPSGLICVAGYCEPTGSPPSDGAVTGWDGRDASPPPACTAMAETYEQLAAGVAGLGPGVVLCLAPGTYVIAATIDFPVASSGAAGNPAVMAPRDGPGTVTIDGNGLAEAFELDGAAWVTIRGLTFTGAGEHAIRIDMPSTDLLFEENTFFDNFALAPESGQFADLRGNCGVPRVTVRGCEFRQVEIFRANESMHGVSCDGCVDWIISGNRFFDIIGKSSGTAILMSGASSGTVISGNVMARNHVGISYGSTATTTCDGDTAQHIGGIVRNNVIVESVDSGITIMQTRDAKVFNNSLWQNGVSSDVRISAENLQVRNNILDWPLNLRDGTTATVSNDVILSAPTDTSLYADAVGGDFHLAASAAEAIDQGMDLRVDVPDDLDGDSRPQGTALDVGADERR